MSSLDEMTHGEDLDWGEVRSACAARDWRRAWEAVGVDHEGDATPGEVYLFGVAKGVRAVSAALFHWRSERRSEIHERMMARIRHKQAKTPGPHGVPPLPEYEASWARIKQVASWESSAAAQHVSKLAVKVVQDVRITVGGVELGELNAASRFTREAFDRLVDALPTGGLGIPASVRDDAHAVLADLLTKGAAERSTVALPSDMRMRWVDHEGSPLEDLRQAMELRATGTLTMHEDVARALANHPDLRPLTQARAERAGLNPNPRGPAQRKRRAR